MKEQFSPNEKHFKLFRQYKELYATLEGNSKSFDPPLAGFKNMVVISNIDTISRKGKPQYVTILREVGTGRDCIIYTGTWKKTYNEVAQWKTGDVLKGKLTVQNGFYDFRGEPVDHLDEIPKKPTKPTSVQTIFAYDLEVFKQDFLFVAKEIGTENWVVINNDLQAMREFYMGHRDSLFIGYNSANYDTPVLRGYLQGKDPFELSDCIVNGERNNLWGLFNSKKTPLFGVDLYHDDRGSLKEHSGFSGIDIRETEVDFTLDRELTPEEKVQNVEYCKNDVKATETRFWQKIDMLLAKMVLLADFGLNKEWLNRTNPSITAQILGAERTADRGDERADYKLPACFEIEDKTVLDMFTGQLDDELKLEVERRDVTLVMGEGGSHSAIERFICTNKPTFHNDAGSLHPNSMRLFDLQSRNILDKTIYLDIIQKRLNAKHNKKSKIIINGVEIDGWVLDMGYKLPLNSTYGALGAEFNPLFDPRNRLLVCVVGQLAFYDLLEKLEPHGLITQTNTDAIDCQFFSDEDKEKALQIMRDFEERTGYELDTEPYVGIYQANVNNYIKVNEDLSVEVKGGIGLNRGTNITKAVVSNAFINFVVSGYDYKKYIDEETTIRAFQIISKMGNGYKKALLIDEETGSYTVAQKVNRVFAVKEPNTLKLKKRKMIKVVYPEKPKLTGESKVDKRKLELYNKKYMEVDELLKSGITELPQTDSMLQNEPDNYVIDNRACGEGITLDEIDKDYYKGEVERHLVNWFASQEEVKELGSEGALKLVIERLEKAHQEQTYPELPVKEYITGE